MDLVARHDVPDYSSIHGLVNHIIALIIGVVKEDIEMRKIVREESCAGEGACYPEAVCLSDLKTANTVVCFIIRECFFVLISCLLSRQI
jgi:hypothetical protein